MPHGEYGMAVNKGKNADLLAAIDDGLNKLIASGEYETIVAQYLGADGAKEQVEAISGKVTDNGADGEAQKKVGFVGCCFRLDESIGEQDSERRVQGLYRSVPRHSDSGVGVLLLFRCAAADRTQCEHLGCRCVDVVAQFRRISGGDRAWRRAVR